MSIAIFDSQQSFEGSGSYYVSGTSTTIFPGGLSMRDPYVAYARGPESLQSFQSFDYVPVSGTFSYTWRARFTEDGLYALDGIFIERENVSKTGWESPTFFVSLDEIYYQSNSVRFVDFCITEYGVFIVVVEVADPLDNTKSVIYLGTNAYASYTGRNLLSGVEQLSSAFTTVENIFRGVMTTPPSYQDYVDSVATFFDDTTPTTFGLIRVDYGSNPTIVYDRETS